MEWEFIYASVHVEQIDGLELMNFSFETEEKVDLDWSRNVES